MEVPMMLPFIFFFIALFYAMVGFGGGSSYLAVLVLLGFSYREIPSVSLLCNLVVTCGGCWHFYRAGYFKAQTVLPFVLLSIPMAYLGGSLVIHKELFCFILGSSLLAVAIRMFLPTEERPLLKPVNQKILWIAGVPLGGVLGFLAGIVGIGGGIFLSPFLLLMRWANIKEAAASASFFIVVNSAAGLAGQLGKGAVDFSLALPLMIAVFLGGQIGSRFGAYRVPKMRLQQLVAVLVFYVSVRLLMKGAL